MHKTIHTFQKVIQALLCGLFLSFCGSVSASAAEKPNILFIFADDQCYDTIHALGKDEIETPNLDKLVKNGTVFTHTYNMGGWSGAICAASRGMIICGEFLWHAHKAPIQTDYVAEKKLWPQLLETSGYETYFSGKWHIKAPAEKTFMTARNIRPGMPNQTKEGYNRPINGLPDPWDPSDPKFEGFWKGGKHWSAVLADDGVEYLGRAAQQDAPFFMYLAFNAPHDPRQSPKEYVDKYPLKNVDVPEGWLSEYPYGEKMGAGRKLRDEKLAPYPRTENSIKVNRQEYYAIITHMDTQVGRILDALKASGKEDNTYIFFSADHGLSVGHHGLLGKQNMYDHSIRVPFIVNGPNIPKNKKISEPIYLQDVMATSLELAGIEKPERVQFNSVMPLIDGRATKSPYKAIYGGYTSTQRAVIQNDHKLILYPKVPKARLFDLKADPKELKDLADDASQKQRMQKLFKALLELQKENGDTLDLKAVYPELAGSSAANQ